MFAFNGLELTTISQSRIELGGSRLERREQGVSKLRRREFGGYRLRQRELAGSRLRWREGARYQVVGGITSSPGWDGGSLAAPDCEV